MSALLRVSALVCFLLATFIALGDAVVSHSAALVPAGLAFWVASTLVDSR